MEYRISGYAPELSHPVCKLHATLIRANPALSAEYLAWKYDRNPYISDRQIAIVRLGDRVVGMRGAFGTAWTDPDGTTIVLPHADDLIIAPQHRNRGLFIPIMRQLESMLTSHGFGDIVSLSGGTVTQKMQEATGWQDMAGLDALQAGPRAESQPGARRPRRSPSGRLLSRIQRTVVGTGGFAVPKQWEIDRVTNKILRHANSRICVSREFDLDEMARLAAARSATTLVPVRTTEFFSWRLANPQRRYRALYWQDTGLRGYAVLGWPTRNPLRMDIVDFAFEDDAFFLDAISAITAYSDLSVRVLRNSLTGIEEKLAAGLGFVAEQELLEHPIPRRFQRKRLAGRPSAGDPVFSGNCGPGLGILDTMNG